MVSDFCCSWQPAAALLWLLELRLHYYSNSFTVVPKRKKKERKKTRKKIHYQKVSPAPEHLILFGGVGGLLPDKTNTQTKLTGAPLSIFFISSSLADPTRHLFSSSISVGEQLNPIKETIKAHTIRRRNNTVRWRIPLMHHQMHTGCV